MNAIQIVGAASTLLGVILLSVLVSGRLLHPAGHNNRAMLSDALLPAGSGLFLIGVVLMAR